MRPRSLRGKYLPSLRCITMNISMRNEPTLPIATFMKYCIDMNAMEAMHATIIALLQLAGVKPHALCSTKSMSTAIICVRTCSTVALASHHLNPDFTAVYLSERVHDAECQRAYPKSY